MELAILFVRYVLHSCSSFNLPLLFLTLLGGLAIVGGAVAAGATSMAGAVAAVEAAASGAPVAISVAGAGAAGTAASVISRLHSAKLIYGKYEELTAKRKDLRSRLHVLRASEEESSKKITKTEMKIRKLRVKDKETGENM